MFYMKDYYYLEAHMLQKTFSTPLIILLQCNNLSLFCATTCNLKVVYTLDTFQFSDIFQLSSACSTFNNTQKKKFWHSLLSSAIV